MATLTVWRFKEPEGAARAASTLADLQSQGLIAVHDAATVSWPMGRKRPKTRQLHNLAGAGALSGSFWGLLFGLLFFIPFAGWAIGAGFGALFGHLGKNAIDQTFQQQVRDYVQPGTSALFMIIEKATPDKAIAALDQYGGTVIKTSLSDEDTAKLQEALQAKEPAEATA
jgi:uncharacterized membrane protein